MGSEGPITEVPDVVGLGAAEACALVRAAGLIPYGPDFEPEPTSGVVSGQAPIGAAGAERGAPVFLWTRGGRGGDAEILPPTPVESGSLDPV